MKCFLRKLLWNCLSCKLTLKQKGIIPDNILYCDLYANMVEDPEHVIISCPFANRYWAQLAMISEQFYIPPSLLALTTCLANAKVEKRT